ncbi:MAG TPA: TnsA-like heteromeric transposase endonuclease subunit [Streptosporangiaceae bacterium]|nr:TnsA-like heteromeric transposase endonuclease subunit [Streptosporangiaceae bacterium]
MADGSEASLPLRLVQARQVIAAVPWRKTRSARGQAHYPGYFWSATMGGHVIYESRLELARLLLADFNRDVTAIAAQPFLLQARVAGTARRHVPDFLLAHTDSSVRVVNVKPTGKLAEPRIAEALAWPGSREVHCGSAGGRCCARQSTPMRHAASPPAKPSPARITVPGRAAWGCPSGPAPTRSKPGAADIRTAPESAGCWPWPRATRRCSRRVGVAGGSRPPGGDPRPLLQSGLGTEQDIADRPAS